MKTNGWNSLLYSFNEDVMSQGTSYQGVIKELMRLIDDASEYHNIAREPPLKSK